MVISMLNYAAAFVDDGAGSSSIDGPFVAVGLAIAPFVFVALAFVSQASQAPKNILWAMLLLLGVGLSIGLIDPLLGAATGFAAGGVVTLRRPPVERVVLWRVGAVVFTCLYCLVLLVSISPAGVLSAAVLPLVMLGFADEYARYTHPE